MQEKICSKCKELKLLSEFYRDKSRKDNHTYICKACLKVINQESYFRNRETKRNYRRKHKNKITKYQKEWTQNNQEYLRQYEIERGKRYRREHRERIKKNKKVYRQSPAGKATGLRDKFKRKAALESCEINDLSTEQIKILFQKSTHCAICKKLFTKLRKKSLDHIIPLSKKGNNTLMNVWIVCLKCNLKKGNKDYTEFNGGQLLMFS